MHGLGKAWFVIMKGDKRKRLRESASLLLPFGWKRSWSSQRLSMTISCIVKWAFSHFLLGKCSRNDSVGCIHIHYKKVVTGAPKLPYDHTLSLFSPREISPTMRSPYNFSSLVESTFTIAGFIYPLHTFSISAKLA